MDINEGRETLQQLLKSAHKVVFFGGAGVSTESGIPDFRSQDGLYNQQYSYPPEQILSHDFFVHNTEEFYKFYKQKMLVLDAQPNGAHKKLAQWEKKGLLSAVITQNIDGLHQKAGSKNVLELHGSIYRNHCTKCGKSYDAQYIKYSKGIPLCSACGGIIKPDVVLYGEQLDETVTERSVIALKNADLLIIGGTSLNVYPAAGLIAYYGGKRIVVINKQPPNRIVRSVCYIEAPIGQLLEQL